MNAQKAVTGAICLASVAVIILALIGGFINFSPVPFWDMWDGTLGFLQRFDSDPLSAMFGQHNEHRIVLTRILFLMEYKVFNGSSLFLIIMNYVCAAAACAIFSFSLYLRNKATAPRLHILVGSLFLSGWLFLWTQHENFTWAFQSQFFLAQLVPLASCLLLARASLDRSLLKPWFWLAVFAGFASSGTMANGLATLPLMTVGALVLRMGWPRVIILAVASAIAIGLYFTSYTAPSGHGSISDSLLHDPVGMLRFTFRYVGSPFFSIFGMTPIASKIALIAGAGFVIVSALLGLAVLKGRRLHYIASGMLLFILYVGLTAFVTSGGRLFIGQEASLSSRYTTPALMGWAALFCIFSPTILSAFRTAGSERFAALTIFAATSFLLLKYQFAALAPVDGVLHHKDVAALAAELGVADQDYVSTIYPNIQVVMDIASTASRTNLAVFGLEPFRDVRERLGGPAQPSGTSTAPECEGNLERTESIAGVDNMVRVHGWQFNKAATPADEGVEFIDEDGQLVGYAVFGRPRPDVASSIDEDAFYSGFTGYLLAEALARPVDAVAAGCVTSGSFTIPLLIQRGQTIDPAAVSVSTAQLEANSGWDGADHEAQPLAGLEVLGSFVTSDADTGAVRLSLKSGDTFLYRSGPTPSNQTFKIFGRDEHAPLPVALEWNLLEVAPGLAGGETVQIEFTDAGSGWGEWSAIAVRPAEPFAD